MKEKLGLSVLLITLNEENDVRDCLESVKNLADDIVVVDSGSTDKTLDICREYTDKIFRRNWEGYSSQKQFTLEKTKGPWVINIDADERVSKKLAGEITQKLSDSKISNNVSGFNIPFHHFFLRKRIRFGGAAGEKHIRLFRKDKSTYGTTKVHEGIDVSGPIALCKGHIDHFSYESIEDYLSKCNEYTTLIAEKKFKSGKRFHWFYHLRLPWEFLVRYFLKLGFLDGGPGLVYTTLSSYYVWLKFLKIKDHERKMK